MLTTETTMDDEKTKDETADNEDPVNVAFEQIAKARYRIRSHIKRTECIASPFLSELTGCDLHFKLELRQKTGSFKERGACNALLRLSDEKKKRGVVAASAGNHALALAYHGGRLGIPVTCVMPRHAPLTKVETCKSLGANVVIHGEHIAEARERALEIDSSLTYINGFDHPDIIAGAGTIGTEIVEDFPDLDAVVVPIGGAGLIAGMAIAIKELRPEVEVIGVEPEWCASYTAALSKGHEVPVDVGATLADGLAVPTVGRNAFFNSKHLLDKVVQVNEKHIALSILRLLENEKIVAEGGGVVGLAALLQEGVLNELRGKRVVVPLCGGNIDVTTLGRVIERGLAADGRLLRFTATVSDRPGGVSGLTKVIAKAGASIKDIYHERAWLHSSISAVQVKCVVETMGFEHGEKLKRSILSAGYDLQWLQ